MSKTAANRSLVPHLHITDAGCTCWKERKYWFQERRGFDFVMGRGCADENLIAFFANVRQVLKACDIDQDLGLSQAKFHRGDQAMAASKNFRTVGISSQQ